MRNEIIGLTPQDKDRRVAALDALKDRRGRKKDKEELTLEDKIKLEMKKLKADNKRLRALEQVGRKGARV